MSTFKVGDKVRCVSQSDARGVEVGSIYTVKNPQFFKSKIHEDVYCMVLLEVDSSPYDKHFELAQEPVLTPEEVLKHLLAGAKMEYKLDSKWVSHSGDLNLTSVQSLSSLQWRVKPVPEIIEANGRKYKLIEE